jgi:hypothetical protein
MDRQGHHGLTEHASRQTRKALKNTDVIADPLLLILRYALGDPGNIPDFLQHN